MDGEWGPQMIDPLYVVARAALLDRPSQVILAGRPRSFLVVDVKLFAEEVAKLRQVRIQTIA